MFNWYWSLSGWSFLAATLALIALNISAIALLVVFLAKMVTGAMDHDRARCGCNACLIARAKAYNKRDAKMEQRCIARQPVRPHGMLSTREIAVGMIIVGKDNLTRYRIEKIHRREFAYVIELVNLFTMRWSIVHVQNKRLDILMWHQDDVPGQRMVGM